MADPATTDAAADLAKIQSELSALRAENEGLKEVSKAVDQIRENLAVARKANPQAAIVAEAVLRGRTAPVMPTTPEPTPATPTNDLPDDLDERERRLILATRDAALAAIRSEADILRAEQAPMREELVRLRLREQTRALQTAPYAERIKARERDVASLLQDPEALTEGIDARFRQMDYEALYKEHQAATAELKALKDGATVDAERATRATGWAGPGGGGGAGAAPPTDWKSILKDVPANQRMAVIAEKVFAAGR